ncbi:N utilization substance protein A [Halogranum gelatinilyticum]|uniref:Probable transcription termination protein NusA n=1 Tax=Halogranum gelatinilyticum TaxID=660521 RepID=A0A1G9PWQ0_9EURY|nr:NusA-like transcription termination signal-binding factor [Halogranum gelatinilyticum]SDM02647.1 N utilization substance protein A [Halogranum gelatinilyticum]
MKVTLSDEAMRFMSLFDEVAEVSPKDCLVDEDRLVLLVPAGEMGKAIGPAGKTVKRFEERVGRTVELVEDADTAEAFVASALAPAAIRHVTVSEQDDRVAYVEVEEADRGVAIGSGGANIETARELAQRHYDIDDIQLT